MKKILGDIHEWMFITGVNENRVRLPVKASLTDTIALTWTQNIQIRKDTF